MSSAPPRRANQARTFRRIHMSMTLVWLSLGVPTVLWWRQSVAWVAFMSLYANVVGHWSAWQATRAEENQQPTPAQEISDSP